MKTSITPQDLANLAGKSVEQTHIDGADICNKNFGKFGIISRNHAAAFLAQMCYESGGFTRLSENLNYSAERLREVWPNRFPTLAVAQQYARNPERLGNYVYANRNGNGSEASGDGWRFRGSGWIQLTGRSNFRAAGKSLGVDLEGNPDLARTNPYFVLTALDFWVRNGLNSLCDGTVASFNKISRGINIGNVNSSSTAHGEEERAALFKKALRIVGDYVYTPPTVIAPTPVPPPVVTTVPPVIVPPKPAPKPAENLNWFQRFLNSIFG